LVTEQATSHAAAVGALRMACDTAREQADTSRCGMAGARRTMWQAYALLAEAQLRVGDIGGQPDQRVNARRTIVSRGPRPIESWQTDSAESRLRPAGDDAAPGRPLEIVIVAGDPTDLRPALVGLVGCTVANRLHIFPNGAEAGDFLLRDGDASLPRPGLTPLASTRTADEDREPRAEGPRGEQLRDGPLVLARCDRAAPPVPHREAMLPDLIEPLTIREREVLDLLARRLSNKEIADTLCVSWQTVAKHTNNLYQKLRVTGRRDAVEQAVAIGVLPAAARGVALLEPVPQLPVPFTFPPQRF
jgi:DNA-binding CsgD family transcriptional regulator